MQQGLEMIPYEWRMGANFISHEVIEAAIEKAKAKRVAAVETPPPSSPPAQSEE